MKKRLNTYELKIIIKVLLITVLVLIFVWISVFFFYPFHYIFGNISDEVWNNDEEFLLDYTVELQKQPNEDFVVLNLSDVQISNFSLINGGFIKAKNLINKLVDEIDPDLITLTGDNLNGPVNYLIAEQFTTFIDHFNIPWAPVMGNHDAEGSGDNNWVADLFLTSNNCVLKKGPNDMGVGNYAITIMENDEIVSAIIMMDSHSYKGDGYDHIWQNQLEWYNWIVNGLNGIAGHIVTNIAMMHIPLFEYVDAWNYWESTNFDSEIGFGEKNERISICETNNGFFNLIKALNSTKVVLCGHDHLNNFSIVYEGVNLAYATKSSDASYNNSKLGGTILTISNSNIILEHYLP